MKTYKVLRVDWIDSTSHSGWNDREHLETHHCNSCISCGIQVKTEKGTLGIAHSACVENSDICDTIIIPRKAIRKIERITTFRA